MTERFDEFFRRATGSVPFDYQRRLALGDRLPSLLEAPTGAGKTAAAFFAWFWRRFEADEATRRATPRRLVYCLPMRALVEQTRQSIADWIDALDLTIPVHTMLGGAVDETWEDQPDNERVLVGTQDQLLSRALNRGYGMAPGRWPMHFALLNDDCLWVMDEVQLMGPGLSTSAQLQAFRERLGTWHPTHTLWMSATLDRTRLDTIDLRGRELASQAFDVDAPGSEDLEDRLKAPKSLRRAAAAVGKKTDYTALASEIRATHRSGSLTLVVLNRVERAQDLYRALHRSAGEDAVALLHSRYRPADRERIQREVLKPGWNGILVATQVVEAGVDLSARTLFSELAPWEALVQRFGRCNRRGEFDDATVHWIDSDLEATVIAPYAVDDIAWSREQLRRQNDVGIRHLRHVAPEPAGPTMPVLRLRDLLQLFDTSPDLSGAHLDISRFVRDADGRDVAVAWRTLAPGASSPADDSPMPHRDELCSVPVWRLGKLLTAGQAHAWRRDRQARRWQTVRADQVVPGVTLLLATEAGGYDETLGFTGDRKHRPSPMSVSGVAPDDDDADGLAYGASDYISLATHANDAAEEMERLVDALSHDGLPNHTLVQAARFHDHGKAHEAMQALLLDGLDPDDPARDGGPWAKSRTDGHRRRQRTRPHFRHELASALAWLANGGDDLAGYLIAAHHGKVRLDLRPRPNERRPPDRRAYAHGVWEGDTLPETDLGAGVTAPEVTLKVKDLMELGGGDSLSWSARTRALLETHGPFRLALLETLVRVADWRASRRHTPQGSLKGILDA